MCYVNYSLLVYLLKIAISMAKKAASLARELKSMKSDLCFMQERCAFLEEENRRFRDGFAKGIRPEEDDLVICSTPVFWFNKFISTSYEHAVIPMEFIWADEATNGGTSC